MRERRGESEGEERLRSKEGRKEADMNACAWEKEMEERKQRERDREGKNEEVKWRAEVIKHSKEDHNYEEDKRLDNKK